MVCGVLKMELKEYIKLKCKDLDERGEIDFDINIDYVDKKFYVVNQSYNKIKFKLVKNGI